MIKVRRLVSRFGPEIRAYLALKRALGRKYRGEEQTLRHLDQYVARRFPAAMDLSVSILEDWLTKGCRVQPRSRITNLARVRQFCLYRRRTNSTAFVPERLQHRTLWPGRFTRRMPVVLSREAVKELLRAALAQPAASRSEPSPQTLFVVFLLLYTTGLRRSEAVRLRVGDVDFDVGTVLVRDTKFFKTRSVPVAADVLALLRQHVERLPRASRATGLEQPLFQNRGAALSAGLVSARFARLMRALGFKPAVGRCGCRLHDLRATFAVHRLEQWYAEGADVQNRLPALSTYLGHKSIAATQHYVTITATLLRQASRRFERACAPHGGT